MFLFQLNERVGEKNKVTPKVAPKANPLEKMLKTADEEEMDEYDKIRMRNIQQRLELFKQVGLEPQDE